MGYVAILLRCCHKQTPFFEKKQKEPKKNEKRKEKERNSVTTTVGQQARVDGGLRRNSINLRVLLIIVILNEVKNLYPRFADIRDVSATLNMTFLEYALKYWREDNHFSPILQRKGEIIIKIHLIYPHSGANTSRHFVKLHPTLDQNESSQQRKFS